MTELDLYKFVNSNNIECHKTFENDVILFVENYHLDEWNKLLGSGITDEDGISCVMKDGYFCFMMRDICEYFGIELFKVFNDDTLTV